MKKRADVLVTELGLAPTRSRARALLMGGRVFWGEHRIDKPGALLAADATLVLREGRQYVSRGGVKLRGALKQLNVSVAGATVADIGACTGGFTDCVLQAGGDHVFAVDVGHGQLAEKLRRDPRVTVMERTNARYLTASDFDRPIDVAVVDVSFIGLDKLLPAVVRILGPGGRLLALVKPQFEAGRAQASRGKGIIRDERVRQAAIDGARAAIEAHGFEVVNECDSPIAGPKGNLEHFVLAQRIPPGR